MHQGSLKTVILDVMAVLKDRATRVVPISSNTLSGSYRTTVGLASNPFAAARVPIQAIVERLDGEGWISSQ